MKLGTLTCDAGMLSGSLTCLSSNTEFWGFPWQTSSGTIPSQSWNHEGNHKFPRMFLYPSVVMSRRYIFSAFSKYVSTYDGLIGMLSYRELKKLCVNEYSSIAQK